MPMPPRRLRAFAFVFGVAMLAFSGWASADPPSRVARLGYLSGPVSFSPAGENDWVEAGLNRPLTSGDRLWADRGARAEVQLGGAVLRMSADTALAVLNLDDRTTQLQLTQGVLNLRVRRLPANQVFEIDTPNLAFTLRRPGQYRISVDADGNTTTILVRQGQGEVHGDGVAYVIDAGRPYRFSGNDLRQRQSFDAPRPDDFDRWSSDRDRRYDNSASARYVSADVIGYQDLDSHGAWRVDATYGNVWAPSRVASGWAPYRDGHWAWVDPWGWTWIDDAPWGFAVSHYGRWAHLDRGWAWVPGPVRSRAYYAPALVVFVGGSNFQLQIASDNVNAVAWFPLAPREVYRPSYPVSRGYFENLNSSNTVINTTVINNTYNNINVTNVVYANRQVTGAVVAVPATVFVQSQPVAKAARPLPRAMLATAPVAIAAPVAPNEKSVRGDAARRDQPPTRVFERPVVARSTPPAAHAGLAAQQPQLAAQPGQPLDDKARKQIKRAPEAPAPVVKLAAPAPQAAQPLRESTPEAAAPPRGNGNRQERQERQDAKEPKDRPDKAEPKGRAPAAPAPNAPEPARTAAPAPAPRAQEPAAEPPARQRGNSGQPGKSDQPGRPEPAPADKPQQPARKAPPATPVVAPTPTAQPAAQAPAAPAPPAATAPATPAASAPAARAPNQKNKKDRDETNVEEGKGNRKP